MDNPETLATLGTKHMIKRNQTQYNTEHQIPGVKPGAREG